MKNKCFLVTGAAGFVGSAVARKLVNMGSKVVTIDNLSTGKEENIPENVEFIKGSVGDIKTIDKLDNRYFDGIFHIAGQSSGEVSFENPTYDLESNTKSTLLLLQYAYKNQIKNIIFASTMSVYGEQEYLPVSEITPLNPKSFYSCSKIASENYMKIYSEMGINCSVLRLFNVYGPGQNLDNFKQGMLSIFLAQSLYNDKIIVKGSLERFRDFIYIDDVVDAFVTAYSSDKKFEVYNVCSGFPIKVKELIEEIERVLERKIPVIVESGTPGDQFGIYGTAWKAKKNLSWEPKTKFEDGLQKMIEWASK